MTLGATSRIIGILLPLDGRETSLLLLDGYRGRRLRMGSKALGPPFRYIAAIPQSGFVRRPAVSEARRRRPLVAYATRCGGIDGVRHKIKHAPLLSTAFTAGA
jgi:hypothetical protein